MKDVCWLNASGHEMRNEDWGDRNMRCFGMLLDGRARATGIRRASSDATMLLVLNSHHSGVGFILPEVAGGRTWRLVFDTNAPNHEENFSVGDEYMVTGRSVLLFERLLDWDQVERRRTPAVGAKSPTP